MKPTEQLAEMIRGMDVDPSSDLPADVQKALQLARHLQARGRDLQTPEEKRQQSELERMMESAQDKVALTQMTDQAFRSKTASRAADQLMHILDVQGVPRFFGALDRAMLKGFQSFGSYLPGVSMPMVKEKMRAETANVILPAEKELLVPHLDERKKGGLRMNVNFLGEALLGEEDAEGRLESYLAALQLPEIEVISVKVSTIYSQITPLSRRFAERVLCDRMELLYRAAAKGRFVREDGTEVSKFVYLDMEEYRDLWITVDVFMKTLDRPGLENVSAGLALQAYVPDSFEAQRVINEWAKKRVAAGGAPVTIRLVKGANMEAERVEASVHGWPQAPYKDKLDTDANYKRMLHAALEPDTLKAVTIGVASHNLFEIAYALVLCAERGIVDNVQFEMLEGMANHQRRALCEVATNVLLYAPATRREEFINAIGYLIRRLDENSGPQNFLRHAFKLKVDSEEWTELERMFVESYRRSADVSVEARRTQNRREEPTRLEGPFVNEPDTDFSLIENLEWAESIREAWRDKCVDVPLVLGGEEITSDRPTKEATDPSRPGVVVAKYLEASEEDIDRALACAKEDPTGWRKMDAAERSKILSNAAHELRKARGDLLGAALVDGGKLLSETDPEVSEAIDFIEYYARTADAFRQLDTVDVEPKGVVAVVPPWNFPCAIPCGGVSAALAAGNTVILKPASDTVLVAYELCKCFWRGGVPKEVLQFAPCRGSKGGARLVGSDVVDAVILTGGTETALRMLEARPTMHLLAETGGKNGTIVTAMSDREQAIKHVVHSAFSHTGQKCSATSLLVLEAEVYDDPSFKKTLVDAVESVRVGSSFDFDSRMGPMVRAPDGDLERGLKELEPGESWALIPRKVGDNPNLYTPGIKWDVKPGSYTHMTEFFGPVLAVLRADDLHHAIEIVNQTGYGLTSGIESLDSREQEIWRDAIRAGNLYINRGTTGAIVTRQPFGGMGKSAFGPGIKAGGPNYVAQLMRFTDKDGPIPDDAVATPEVEKLRRALMGAEHQPTRRAIASYDAAYATEFGQWHDDVKLVGQDNFRRYLPVSHLRIRVHADDTPFEIFARVAAAKTVGCGITVSVPPDLKSDTVKELDRATESWGAGIEFVEETDEALAEVVREHQTDRIRYASPDRVPLVVRQAIGDTGIYIADTPVLIEGRVELMWYVREQSVSVDYHRYGNLGLRGDEPRRPVL